MKSKYASSFSSIKSYIIAGEWKMVRLMTSRVIESVYKSPYWEKSPWGLQAPDYILRTDFDLKLNQDGIIIHWNGYDLRRVTILPKTKSRMASCAMCDDAWPRYALMGLRNVFAYETRHVAFRTGEGCWISVCWARTHVPYLFDMGNRD